jgi:hypothetical protein
MAEKASEAGAPPQTPLTDEHLSRIELGCGKYNYWGEAADVRAMLVEVRRLRAIEKAARDYDEQGENCTMGYRPCSHCDARVALQRLLGTADDRP